MKRLIYAALSSLALVSATMPAKANTQSFVIAQSQSTIEQMYKQQRVLTEEIQSLMTQMKIMMAEMKVLTAMPPEKSVTMNDLYKQQQLLSAKVDTLIGRTRLDAIAPRTDTATAETIQQQQMGMIAEMKEMMTEMKRMITVHRGRVTDRNQ
ncbi:MAG: hypothetical protein NW220_21430 [Leptolyngbyaceae cyanobacterium bins.349]|nr:hypothetical protein [Leptolyngbyaceae cyanobacterium bins.349]